MPYNPVRLIYESILFEGRPTDLSDCFVKIPFAQLHLVDSECNLCLIVQYALQNSFKNPFIEDTPYNSVCSIRVENTVLANLIIKIITMSIIYFVSVVDLDQHNLN